MCEQWNHRKDIVEYSNWKEKHICAINHTGSAVAMEIIGLKRIFHRCVNTTCDTLFMLVMEILNKWIWAILTYFY